jgi:nitrogen fixation protein FixH
MMANSAAAQASEADAGRYPGRVLTGRMVLAIVACFFATIGAVNAVMMRFAMTSFRGEVVEHPYEAGLVFNSQIAAARAQAGRNWSVEARIDANPASRRVHVSVRDAEGLPLKGLNVTVEFRGPVDNRIDRYIRLEEREQGLYEADVAVGSGAWDFDIAATRDGETLFRSRSRIRLE